MSVYWTGSGEEVGGGGGLTLHVSGGRVPGLTLESSPTGRLRLRAPHASLLWARIDEGYYGVWLLRRSTVSSPAIVSPIRAREARALHRVDDWMRFFARALEGSPRSPLRPGTWQLTELRPLHSGARGESAALASTDPDLLPGSAHSLGDAMTFPRLAYVPWGATAPYRVGPLRGFSRSHTSRVESWRKHAREGTLPPIVLWLVHGIDMLLILDGHDRLSAAVAKAVMPKVIVLWQVDERPSEDGAIERERIAQAYTKAHERSESLSAGTRHMLNETLVRAFNAHRTSLTTARAAPGMDAIWFEEVCAELEGDDSEDAEAMLAPQ